MLNKLKSLLLDDTVYMAVLLVLVGIASFGLGRMSVNLPQNQSATVAQSQINIPNNPELPPISTTTQSGPVQTIASSPPVENTPQNFVASKSGTKYHALTCPGAKQIKDTNKIFFATELEAEASGYTRASNCKF